jgi:hypothetical protein
MDIDLTKGKIKSPLKPSFFFCMFSEANPIRIHNLTADSNFQLTSYLILSNHFQQILKMRSDESIYSISTYIRELRFYVEVFS